ncbi:S-adenosyl-L-methionine-dependent methyltransferase [Roridomyces roridus]|uniref:S-adenosyl-L-methionine-dependent methyltransferase n=1 Tax=Roridomyces roridus TaxID=1738132 RepID=A0AAD7B754_9AGAR|nr:S-adenosyl-L-methionine-dependent methyltransferase [Roridomyces roridus]
MVDELGDITGKTVIDIGCGTGELAIVLARRVGRGGKVIGVDPEDRRIAIASQRAADHPELRVSFFVGTASDIVRIVDQQEVGQIDIVVMSSVLHWIEDKPAALRAIHSILAPGGMFGSSSGSGVKHPLEKKDNVLSQEPFRGYRKEGAAEFVSENELRALLVNAGFRVDTLSHLDEMVEFDNGAAAMGWLNASAFGNFTHVEYLPPGLQALATERIEEAYATIADATGVTGFPVTMLIVTASKNAV